MTNTFSKKLFNNHWLAGLIDGDGCFLISSKGYASLEITVATPDLPMLQILQDRYGGSLKPRAGTRSVRYRLHNKLGLLKCVQDVNGCIRNVIRQNQLKRVCKLYGMQLKLPELNCWDSAYVSGLFDSDGTIRISVKRHMAPQNVKGTEGKILRLSQASSTQLTLSITQKYRENLIFLYQKDKSCFGRLSYDKSQNGYYTWYVTSRKDIFQMLAYFDTYPCHSVRRHRVGLVKAYYALLDHEKTVFNKACPSSNGENYDGGRCLWSTKLTKNNFARDWFKYDI